MPSALNFVIPSKDLIWWINLSRKGIWTGWAMSFFMVEFSEYAILAKWRLQREKHAPERKACSREKSIVSESLPSGASGEKNMHRLDAPESTIG